MWLNTNRLLTFNTFSVSIAIVLFSSRKTISIVGLWFNKSDKTIEFNPFQKHNLTTSNKTASTSIFCNLHSYVSIQMLSIAFQIAPRCICSTNTRGDLGKLLRISTILLEKARQAQTPRLCNSWKQAGSTFELLIGSGSKDHHRPEASLASPPLISQLGSGLGSPASDNEPTVSSLWIAGWLNSSLRGLAYFRIIFAENIASWKTIKSS